MKFSTPRASQTRPTQDIFLFYPEERKRNLGGANWLLPPLARIEVICFVSLLFPAMNKINAVVRFSRDIAFLFLFPLSCMEKWVSLFWTCLVGASPRLDAGEAVE